MKTMPTYVLRPMRSAVEGILTAVQRWEDRHADPADYRMTELTSGLWQASQAMKALISGEFDPHRKAQHLLNLPEGRLLGEQYSQELLGGAPVPLRVVD